VRETTHPVCRTCGVQYDAIHYNSAHCKICEDERQYVGWDGQQWTTLAEMAQAGQRNVVKQETPGVWGVGADPAFAIGQRALVIPGDGGNLLWDCVTYLDQETVDQLERLGGLAAIAISHPHYYGAMIDWSHAFGDIPVYLHAADREWVCREGNIRYWDGDTLEVLPGRTLINCGVHFAGGTVLHWADGADGRGAVCSGDILQVVMDRRHVGFMYSYPNLIPEHPDTVRRAVDLLEPLPFDVDYGAWWGRVVPADAKAALRRSADRYLRHLGLPDVSRGQTGPR
jgi:hypothetical protein